MEQAKITKQSFLDYYFDSGSDDEMEDMRKDLFENVIEQLRTKGTATITVDQIFKDCTGEIPKRYFEGFQEDCDDDEFDNEVEYILID